MVDDKNNDNLKILTLFKMIGILYTLYINSYSDKSFPYLFGVEKLL